MNAVIEYLFGAASFVPHGYCLLWRPDLVAMHAVSDFVIALAYFAIPIGIWHFARRRTDLEFRGLFYLFAAFILCCGLTHLAGLITLWVPAYGIQGLIKALTAIVSVASAYALWPVIPKALAIPGITRLREENAEMARAVAEQERQVAERNAELSNMTREVETFTQTVAHDLRTPLRSINGFSQMLADEHGQALGVSGWEMLNRIRMASTRMSSLIDDLLMISRVERTLLEIADVNLSIMAKTILSDLSRKDPGRKVEIAVEDGIIMPCDRKLMEIALKHLLENAWKFTNAREQAKIEVGYQQKDGQPSIYIRDNGVGFDQAYAGKLFLPFQRMHSQEQFPGNGIGLAIVASIIHRHGGEIQAASVFSEGTTVSFTLRNEKEQITHDEQCDLAC